MTDLRTYMSTEFFEDTRIVNELQLAIGRVAETFENTYDSTNSSWPYELRPLDSRPPGVQSQGTTAMILCSALAVRGEWPKPPYLRASSGMTYTQDFPLSEVVIVGIAKQDKKTDDLITSAIKELVTKWKDDTSKPPVTTTSRSFGKDDPMLLGWAIDLVRYLQGRAPSSENEAILQQIEATCVHKVNALCGLGRAKPLNHAIMAPADENKVGDSSYILVRFARVLRSLKASCTDEGRKELFGRAQQLMFAYFQSRLHEYLSFAGITDSRFDPAELAFCLEGMLLVREYGVQRSVFDRVMSILRQVQDKNGYWSNTTPMLYQQKGDVLFTVSVEAANAILTSFALQDGTRRIHGSAASDHIDLAKRFWQWVESRRAQVRIGALELSGWHSEHVNDPNLVHLWETSQILEFLVNFRDQLIRHVARTSLRLAACSYRLPAKPKPVEAPTDPTPESRWEAASKTYEPVTSLGPDYKIFEQIGKLFVAPRFNPAGKPDYSMLLYGPPGTGKTTVASSLSWALDYPLITISVSDFLADGHAAIEARAKHLFEMLRAQPRCVVLFDEIDQFMLDRDSEYFRDLDTVFQFLTPGMLTKLADLRDSKSVIFIMATNYAERIDAAIKRQGRIDRHFLLLPADQSRRREFAERIWKSTPIDFDRAAINSVFLGYSDMESISPQRVDPADAVERLEALPRAARPTMYLSRFYDKQGKPIAEVRRTPAEELFAMLALEAEAKGKTLRRSEVQAYIAAFLDERFGLDNWPEGLREELNSKRFRIGSV